MYAAPTYRIYVRIALVATAVQFVIFKLCYPRAGFINGDSYVYLQSAMYNSDINTYPVGYSKFLRIFSTFTRSHTLILFFTFTVRYNALEIFFPIPRWLKSAIQCRSLSALCVHPPPDTLST